MRPNGSLHRPSPGAEPVPASSRRRAGLRAKFRLSVGMKFTRREDLRRAGRGQTGCLRASSWVFTGSWSSTRIGACTATSAHPPIAPGQLHTFAASNCLFVRSQSDGIERGEIERGLDVARSARPEISQKRSEHPAQQPADLHAGTFTPAERPADRTRRAVGAILKNGQFSHGVLLP